MSAAPVSAENVEMYILCVFKYVALHRAGSQAVAPSGGLFHFPFIGVDGERRRTRAAGRVPK